MQLIDQTKLHKLLPMDSVDRKMNKLRVFTFDQLNKSDLLTESWFI